MRQTIFSFLAIAASLNLVPVSAFAAEMTAEDSAEARAELTVSQMNANEKTVLTHGIMPVPVGLDPSQIPADAIPGAGYIEGIPRLGVPALKETDASLGVASFGGVRGDGATALPSGLAMASTWNPGLIEQGGQMIGSEARAKGFNVMLAGGVNLMRDPRNGRNFEYLGEDPLLAGTLVGHAIRGVQSNHIISTIKHLALNGQETGRKYADSIISPAAAHESDLLAFKLGIEIGNPGAVMCAYNRVNGDQACDSDWLMNRVLKQQWGYKGFVMSDWGAVPGVGAALNGLDQQSGEQLDKAVYFDEKLAEMSSKDPAYAARVDDMNKRVLWAIYSNGLDRHPAQTGGEIDFEGHAKVAEEVAKQGIVLLRNQNNILPLDNKAMRIAVIGGFADAGVISGAGSSQVLSEDGPAIKIPLEAKGPFDVFRNQLYHTSSPLAAIKAIAPKADVRFRDGRYISEAVAQARKADVAIVFVTQWSSEGYDQPDMSLPLGQDTLVAAVADANPNTIVVLETGGPVLMPWLDQTAAVIEAWYSGARGGEAIASVLFGETNPSGRLPVTFPASVEHLPRKFVDGFDVVEPNFPGDPPSADAEILVDYNIEGSDLGYRWNAREGYKALFPFGYGLSYTSFGYSGLKTDGSTASFKVKNTGSKAGATVTQLYLVSRNGQTRQRLVGYQRVTLKRGMTENVSLTIDPRLLADWTEQGWLIPAGEYRFALGENAENLGAEIAVELPERLWKN